MKRLWRWLLNVLAALSLLLCVATAVLWVRSHWRCDCIYRNCSDLRHWSVSTCNDGGVFLRIRRMERGVSQHARLVLFRELAP